MKFSKFTDYLLPVDSMGKLVENLMWRWNVDRYVYLYVSFVPVYGIEYKVCNLIVSINAVL